MKQKKYSCLKCGKPVFELDYKQSGKGYKDTQRMWQYGVVFELTAGYGSAHDGQIFHAALCDDCIDELATEEKIKFIKDYIHGTKKYIPLRGDNK